MTSPRSPRIPTHPRLDARVQGVDARGVNGVVRVQRRAIQRVGRGEVHPLHALAQPGEVSEVSPGPFGDGVGLPGVRSSEVTGST